MVWVDGFVSIRAPARGATNGAQLVSAGLPVSIRAPARGATTDFASSTSTPRSFDPRSRAGSDHTSRAPTARTGCFDPRSRAGSDLQVTQALIAGCLFRSALPRGERPLRLLTSDAEVMFRSALPRGERLQNMQAALAAGRVSIRAPARGATRRLRGPDRIFGSFDPRSRAGSDASLRAIVAEETVSIRAPARGATARANDLHAVDQVSIRAPARGATKCRAAVPRETPFRSALPRGERLGAQREVEARAGFDPRSRAGSDRSASDCSPPTAPFRSALPRGERRNAIDPDGSLTVFRSALPRGERQRSAARCRLIARFRSALPRGERRAARIRTRSRPGVSIRAPARGATVRTGHSTRPDTFRSALPRGERHLHAACHATQHGVSIRAPARGATPKMVCASVSNDCFDPRSRAGSDSSGTVTVPGTVEFRSALPRGERPLPLQLPGRIGKKERLARSQPLPVLPAGDGPAHSL